MWAVNQFSSCANCPGIYPRMVNKKMKETNSDPQSWWWTGVLFARSGSENLSGFKTVMGLAWPNMAMTGIGEFKPGDKFSSHRSHLRRIWSGPDPSCQLWELEFCLCFVHQSSSQWIKRESCVKEETYFSWLEIVSRLVLLNAEHKSNMDHAI